MVRRLLGLLTVARFSSARAYGIGAEIEQYMVEL